MDKWKIELYKTANNQSPIDEFIDSLDVKVQNKIIEVFNAKTGKTFLLLHGFQKKKQKTDEREIKTALDRLLDYKSRTQN